MGDAPMAVEEAPRRGKLSTLKHWFGLVRRIREEPWGEVSGYLFILPAWVMYIVFNIWPTLRGIALAFQDYRFLIPGHSPFSGLDNFLEFSKDHKFWASFGRSAWYTLMYFPLVLAISLMAAAVVAYIRNDLISGFYRVLFYLPVVLPVSVVFLLGRNIFQPQLGYVNHLLRYVLHLKARPGWMVDPNLTIPMAVFIRLWMDFGSMMLLFLIGMYGINPEIYEAASIDGAGTWQQFWRISVPLLKPIFVLILVLNAHLAGSATEMMVLFGTDATYAGPFDSGLLLPFYIYRVAFIFGDMRWGYAAAMSLALGIFSMVMAGIIFKLVKTEAA